MNYNYDEMEGLRYVSMPSDRDKGPSMVCGLRNHHLEVRPPGDDRRGNRKPRTKWQKSGKEARRLHARRRARI